MFIKIIIWDGKNGFYKDNQLFNKERSKWGTETFRPDNRQYEIRVKSLSFWITLSVKHDLATHHL